MNKTIAILLCLIAGLLIAILIAVTAKKEYSRTTTEAMSESEKRSIASLEMLTIADEMPTEFAKQMWIMATKFAMDGYVDDGEPMEMSARFINAATLGYRNVSPPDNGLFPITWKLVRENDLGGTIPPTFLACDSAGGFSYELHDRILQEWQKAIRLLPREDFDQAYTMFLLGEVLHEKQSKEPNELDREIEIRRLHWPEIAVTCTLDKDPRVFHLITKAKSQYFEFEYSIYESDKGSHLVMQINCRKPIPQTESK